MTTAELLDEAEENTDRLSPWELSFVEQMRERFDDGRPLTEGQFDKLQEIAEEKET